VSYFCDRTTLARVSRKHLANVLTTLARVGSYNPLAFLRYLMFP
jgi:hypothetical protein